MSHAKRASALVSGGRFMLAGMALLALGCGGGGGKYAGDKIVGTWIVDREFTQQRFPGSTALRFTGARITFTDNGEFNAMGQTGTWHIDGKDYVLTRGKNRSKARLEGVYLVENTPHIRGGVVFRRADAKKSQARSGMAGSNTPPGGKTQKKPGKKPRQPVVKRPAPKPKVIVGQLRELKIRGISEMAYTLDGNQLLTVGVQGVRLLDLVTDPPREIYAKRFPKIISRINVASDGKHAVAWGFAGEFHYFQVGTGTIIKTMSQPKTITAVAIAPDSKTIATGGSIFGDVKIWDGTSGQIKTTIPQSRSTRTLAAVFAGPDQLLLGDTEGFSTVDPADPGSRKTATFTSKLLIKNIGLSAKQKKAVVTFNSGKASVWNLADAQEGASLADGQVNALQMSGGKWCAISQSTHVSIVDLQAGKVVKRFGPFPTSVRSMAFHPDNNVLAVATLSGVHLIDLNSPGMQEDGATK